MELNGEIIGVAEGIQIGLMLQSGDFAYWAEHDDIQMKLRNQIRYTGAGPFLHQTVRFATDQTLRHTRAGLRAVATEVRLVTAEDTAMVYHTWNEFHRAMFSREGLPDMFKVQDNTVLCGHIIESVIRADLEYSWRPDDRGFMVFAIGK